jgi:hypothetical protein
VVILTRACSHECEVSGEYLAFPLVLLQIAYPCAVACQLRMRC